jgi:hypothetical protein
LRFESIGEGTTLGIVLSSVTAAGQPERLLDWPVLAERLPFNLFGTRQIVSPSRHQEITPPVPISIAIRRHGFSRPAKYLNHEYFLTSSLQSIMGATLIFLFISKYLSSDHQKYSSAFLL